MPVTNTKKRGAPALEGLATKKAKLSPKLGPMSPKKNVVTDIDMGGSHLDAGEVI